MPAGWTGGAINNTQPNNTASYANGVFTVQGQGGVIWDNSDSFEFAAQPLVGDGTIVARMARVQYEDGGVLGLMIREGPTPGGAHAFLGVQGGNTLSFRWRSSTSAGTGNATGALVGAPYWLKLVRQGNVFKGYGSPNGSDWTMIGDPQTVTMGSAAYAGFAVSSQGWWGSITTTRANFDTVVVASAPDFYFTALPLLWSSAAAGDTRSYTLGVSGINGFTGAVAFNVSGLPPGVSTQVNPQSVTGSGSANLTIRPAPGVQPGNYPFTITATSGNLTHSGQATLSVTAAATGALPTGWLTSTIANSNAGNQASYANGVITVTGQGGQFWDNVDSFQFAYQQFTGNGTIIARLTGSQYQDGGTFGLMIREGLTPTAANAFIGLQNGSTLDFQWRASTGAGTSQTSGVAVGAPYWLKLVRQGNSFSAYGSANGVDWVPVGSPQTVNMGSTAFAGLAIKSQGWWGSITSTSASFDRITIQGGSGTGGVPDYSIAAPSDVQAVSAGGSISMPVSVTGSGGFSGAVSFAMTGLPGGATSVFSPSTVSGAGVTTLTINTTSSTVPADIM